MSGVASTEGLAGASGGGETLPPSTRSSRARIAAKLTPAMQQYLEFKSAHEDALLFFRMGDFYELFFEDAETAAELLDLTLTSRNRNDEHPIPMCGIPYHALRPYVARLMEAGRKVAVCEQLELPEKGIARREVTRVISPGTTVDEESLAPDRASYLAAVVQRGESWGLSICDFSTGEMRATELVSGERLDDELRAAAPAEIVLESEAGRSIRTGPGNKADSRAPAMGALRERIARLLPRCVISERPAASDAKDAADAACAVLRGYATATQGGHVEHLRAPVRYETAAYLHLDASTRRNLELLESYDGSSRGSLVSVLDRSTTGMGKRLLRTWLVRPLADPAAIGERLDAVETLIDDYSLRADIRESLRRIGDFERLIGRIGAGSGSPRDVRRLADALASIEELGERISRSGAALARHAASLDGLAGVRSRITATLTDEVAAAIGKGAVIRDGFDADVDRLRAISRDGKGWILSFEAEEKTRTAIPSLKVGFNRVFGYYIEVTHTHQALVPASYTRKQTVANAERYITPELKSRENEVLGAEERLLAKERQLFDALVASLAPSQPSLGRTAAALATLDALSGLAETAHQRGYVRPEMHDGCELDIIGGRHPVVEARLGSSFVANDCRLGEDSRLLMVITGPNMAGKSTYLRQTALIVLLAHCGCFVPATSARIPLVDRIFTRIGASDNLAAGQSTFMVEMSETAAILAAMTERSLVVLDEIGRGTSTFDGISIAWAVAEAMLERHVKTLFATHYHELAALESEHELAENFSVAIRRYKGSVIFLYRIAEGPTSGSYGIEVARLAGVPDAVIDKARGILAKFESGEGIGAASAGQLSLFSARSGDGRGPEESAAEGFAARVAALAPESMTPLEALNLLARLVEEAKAAQ
ncbi:MAG TPA: DNA mismatch repair protein MutS [Candidatus Limnocylindrales bacterium]|nr:DNA mismatch repair protein MutS [Candidatus Limnocylindrales bacterium]